MRIRALPVLLCLILTGCSIKCEMWARDDEAFHECLTTPHCKVTVSDVRYHAGTERNLERHCKKSEP